jgi:CheY-like chemotaxis protein
VTIEVRDDGQGIRAEFLPHLFEPFRQADGSTTRRHGGLGLGLAIVKQLVDAHDGVIVAHSDGEGRGAAFTVELPARASTARDLARAAVVPSTAAPRDIRLDGVRILVVDDDEDSRDLIGLMLVDQGAVVSSAASAAEGLRQLAESPPDVLVSDIGMPDVNGYSLIRRIRSLSSDRGGKTPAVALTAYARAEDGERAFAAGFQAHVTKPVDPERLSAVVANLAGISLDPVSESSLAVWPASRSTGE